MIKFSIQQPQQCQHHEPISTMTATTSNEETYPIVLVLIQVHEWIHSSQWKDKQVAPVIRLGLGLGLT